MELARLERLTDGDGWTAGVLKWEGGFVWTLEREQGVRIKAGTYPLRLRVSPKFKGRAWCREWGGECPEICGVDGRDGILVHVGNTPADSEGCVLVGMEKGAGTLQRSTEAFGVVMGWLAKRRKENVDVYLEVTDI